MEFARRRRRLQREDEPCDHVNETKQAAHVTSTAALVSTLEAMAAQIGDANAWPKAWHMQDGQDDNISKENRYIQMQTHIYIVIASSTLSTQVNILSLRDSNARSKGMRPQSQPAWASTRTMTF